MSLRRILIIFILICLIFIYCSSDSSGNKLSLKDTENYDYHHSGLILNTSGCKIPRFDPYDKTIKHLISKRKPYKCVGDQVFIISMSNNTLIINETILNIHYGVSPKDVSCFYEAIYRSDEHKDKENFITYGKSTKLQFGIPLEEEFLKVTCKLGRYRHFTQYIPLAPIKPEVEKRALDNQFNFTNPLNVILIGIDSVSKLNFLRHFKKTQKFLKSTLSAFEMNGYTKVGDNTFPNLVPLLTGHFVEHYWNESLSNKMFFDHLDFIWSTYSKKGYRTFYAEDMPYCGTFQYLKKGFKKPPTDYYFRTIGLAIEDSALRKKGSYCINNQLEPEIIYGYLMNFVKAMQYRPYFAFAMVSTITHDILNDAGYVDEPTYNLFKELERNDVTNQSMIVFFSDHGIRFGKIRETYIGKLEERMPFMYITMPEWFLKMHTSIRKNLKNNENRLITLFDVHATLHHLLQIVTTPLSDDLESPITPNGLSLFSEISDYRTCEMAKILPHWCPCQVYSKVSKNDIKMMIAAAAIVNYINNQLRKFEEICAHLEMSEIIDARQGQLSTLVLSFVKRVKNVIDPRVVHGDKVSDICDFLITLKTNPGEAIFEGTVRYNSKFNSSEILGISRINMYREQSSCIDSQNLKKFCFCI